MNTVKDLIPQREPFLFVDKIIERNENFVITEKYLDSDLDFFKGHFPNMPIMPGVLLLENCFQSGAILMGNSDTDSTGNYGVVTRIKDTKFKNFAKPGDTLVTKVSIEEKIENAFYMKGSISVNGKLIMQVRFQGALTSL